MAKIKSQITKPKSQKVVKFKNIPKRSILKKEKAPKVIVTAKDQTSRIKQFHTQIKFFNIFKPVSLLEERIKERWKILQTKTFFPKIYRFITEPRVFLSIVCIIFAISSVFLWKNIQSGLEQQKKIEQKRQQIQKQITFWQEITNTHKDYRDGYFQLALLEYQLGNVQASQEDLNTVLLLDPNFSEADKLEKIISNSSR